MDENSVIINSAFGVNIIGKTLTEILLITYTGVGVRVIDLRKIAGVMNKSLFGRIFTDRHRFQYKFAGIKLSGIIEDKMTDFMEVPSPIWEINFIDTNGCLLKAVESPNTPVGLRLGCK
jgi:hypothetical protein